MFNVLDPPPEAAQEGRSETQGLRATLILALGTFAVGTDAYIVAGFLPGMAESLHVTESVAGQSATIFAITYAILSPVLATVAARVPRRVLLVTALLVLALANLGSALAPTYPLLMATRVLAAAGAAAYTPNAGAVASALVPPAQRARALATVVGGLTVATAIGVPTGNLAGQMMSWRAGLGLVATLCTISAAGVYMIMPAMPGNPRVPLRDRLRALRHPGVIAVLPLTTLGLTASYGLYAYAVPILRTLGVRPAAEMWLLFLYGVGAVAGNLLAGAAADRHGPIRVLAIGYAGLTVTLAALAGAAGSGVHWLPLIGLLMMAWGANTWFQTPAQQLRLISAAPQETAVVVGLNASALYTGIALGTVLGGVLLPISASVALAASAVLAALCLVYLAATRHHR
ncbi:MFS transporter [Streptomyces spiralis]